MKDTNKLDLARILKRATKVAGFVATAVLLAVIYSPELRQLISQHPGLVVYAPLINVALAALGDAIKQVVGDEAKISKFI